MRKKADVKRSKKIATQERNREKKEEERRQREAKRNAKRAIGILTKPPGGSPGVPKSEAHKAAISAAVKAKWADPAHVAKRKQTVIERRMRGSGVREREAREIRSQLQELSPQERKRAKLVQEAQEGELLAKRCKKETATHADNLKRKTNRSMGLRVYNAMRHTTGLGIAYFKGKQELGPLGVGETREVNTLTGLTAWNTGSSRSQRTTWPSASRLASLTWIPSSRRYTCAQISVSGFIFVGGCSTT